MALLPEAPKSLSYGAPQLDFSQLGELGNQYYKGAEDKRKYDLARAFQGGLPIDPNTGQVDIRAMTETLARHGAVDIPQMQEQAERSALQNAPTIGGATGAQPGDRYSPSSVRQGPPVTSFRDVTPNTPSKGPQNEGSLNRAAAQGEDLRTLATGLSGGRDVSDIISRFETAYGIRADDALTPEQEEKIRPILAKSIAARAAAAAPVQPQAQRPQIQPQQQSQMQPQAPTALVPPGADPRYEIAKLRLAGEMLLKSAGARGAPLAQQYFDRANTIESDAYGAGAELKRQHRAAEEKPVTVTAGTELVNPLTGIPVVKNDTGLLDKATIDAMARQAMSGDTSVFTNLGRGAQGAENVIAVRKRIAELNSGSGETGAEQAQRNAEFFGVKSGQRTLGTRSANIELAATEFKQVLPVVQAASKAVSRTNYPDLNKIIQMFEEKTGDPNVVKFGGGVNTLVNLYARAISPSGNPTVSDKDHARLILNRAWSQGQFDAAVSMMSQEIDAALSSPDKVRDAMRKRFLEGQGGAKPSGAQIPAVAPANDGWSVREIK